MTENGTSIASLNGTHDRSQPLIQSTKTEREMPQMPDYEKVAEMARGEGPPAYADPGAALGQQHAPQQYASQQYGGDEGYEEEYEPVPQRQRGGSARVPSRTRGRDHGRGRDKRRGGGKGWGLVDKLRSFRSTLLVILVVFGVLQYVAPKVGSTLPYVLGPTGRLNMAGMLVLAVICGGIHRVSDTYVRF